ncbi:MBL fold metallo-hydrolase [Nocardia sp. NBC_01009]|uniref:MBL fold metallo-hydrolase n=1 Tax=Nocardia sp. NBC_01009 TaxID=2975996 RepID=UPI00386B71B0|nr:MBL fold metallo-hydrolase [Nocardia sp. NBC_01009]
MTASFALPDPVVELTDIHELVADLVVIGDRRVPLVPNVGIIGGREAVLVVETGMGPTNAETVLRFAADYAQGRRLYLTTTHFHPEHAFGAHSFAGAATYLVNRAQADDLRYKGAAYLEMFRGLGESVARRLDGVQLPEPDVVYDRTYDLDLGGRIVRMRGTGRAHSKGDQVVELPEEGVLFTGDLVEAAQFAIFPWFPPHDTDVSGVGWIAVMDRLAATRPRLVVPGHGDIGGPQLLTDVGDYLRLLRDETWIRRDGALIEDTIAEEVSALMIERHPEWSGREWIRNGVGCFCAAHRTGDH